MTDKGKKFLLQAGVPSTRMKVSVVADMRYAGQGHEITVQLPAGKLSAATIPAITRAFQTEYRLRYGRDMTGIPIEAVTWRVLVSGPRTSLHPKQSVVGKHHHPLKGKRKVFWGKQYIETPVYDRYLLTPGQRIQGPCIIEEFESTTVVGSHGTVTADQYNNLVIDLS